MVNSETGPGSKRPCCIVVTNMDKCAEVVGETYRQQAARGRCVKAIIFNTKTGQLCADPNTQWLTLRVPRIADP
uniref:Chemokine interleukin-8-like domain-containing protein n=1 Tax=Haplochromis burtoni TaxID=8153 RepID=A0A3Q2WGC3_HAPBU